MSEKLSNLLDKNVAESDLDEFLRECKQDPSLIDRWQRYHLAAGILRDEVNEADLKFDVASKVMAGLQNQEMSPEQSAEQTDAGQTDVGQTDEQQTSEDNSNVIQLNSPSNTTQASDNNLNTEPLVTDQATDQVTGQHSASTRSAKPWLPLALAASMLLGLYFFFQQPVIETSPQQIADNTTVDIAPPSNPVDHWQTSSADVEDVLNSLLVEHSEFTSVTGMNGLGSYSKFIAYQN